MIVVNGVESDFVPALDRGFAFGDGVFETLAVVDGDILNWPRHLSRLTAGCERLSLRMPEADQLVTEIGTVTSGHGRSVVKLIITRGTGGAGYTPPPSPNVTRVVLRRDWPAHYARLAQTGIRVCVASHRLSFNPGLAGLKHLNRLDQVLGSIEMEAQHVDEALMLDFRGRVIEATRSNLFVAFGDRLVTPRLDGCGVLGVMRSLIIERAPELGLQVEEAHLSLPELLRADEIFLCNAIAGIWPVVAIQGTDATEFAIGARTRALQRHQF